MSAIQKHNEIMEKIDELRRQLKAEGIEFPHDMNHPLYKDILECTEQYTALEEEVRTEVYAANDVKEIYRTIKMSHVKYILFHELVKKGLLKV